MNCNTIKWILLIIVVLLSPIIIAIIIATTSHFSEIYWFAKKDEPHLDLYNILYLWLNVFIAVGTIAVAILAVYGDKIKSYLYHPKLRLEIISCDELSKYDYDINKEIFYYHLRVRNVGESNAQNCRVLLKEIHEHDGTIFKAIKFSVPPQFTWAPSEIRPTDPSLATIFRKQSESLAFCRVYKTVGGNPQEKNQLNATDCQIHYVKDNGECTKIEFSAVLCKTSSEKRELQIVLQSYQCFQGWINTQRVRLGMEIIYDNQESDSKKLQFFEINWDGHWHDEPDCLFNNLNIKDVTDEVNKEKIAKQKNEELKRRKDMYEQDRR